MCRQCWGLSRLSFHLPPHGISCVLPDQSLSGHSHCMHVTEKLHFKISQNSKRPIENVVVRCAKWDKTPFQCQVNMRFYKILLPPLPSPVSSEEAEKKIQHRKYFLNCKTWMGSYSYNAPNAQTKPVRKAAQTNTEIPPLYNVSQGMLLFITSNVSHSPQL